MKKKSLLEGKAVRCGYGGIRREDYGGVVQGAFR